MPDSVEAAVESAVDSAALEATAEEPLLPQAAKVPAAMQAAKAMAKVRLTDFFHGVSSLIWFPFL